MNNEPTNCHDCGVAPGQIHKDNCDTERCSVCGGQRLVCDCKGHDKKFSRWMGWFPGVLEAKAIGMGLNEWYEKYGELFFKKPKNRRRVGDTNK